MRSRPLVLSLVFTASCLLLLLAARSVSLSWDESIYTRYSEGLRGWAHAGAPLDAESLRRAWNGEPYHNPHPPFLKVLSAIGAWLTGSFLPFPLAFRVGHAVFAAGLLTLAAALLSAELGLASALAALAFVAAQPRLFTEFLLCTLDGPVALAWLALALLTWRLSGNPRSRRAWLAFFLVHAAVAGVKFTGFLAVLPALAWFAWRREWRSVGLAVLSCAGAILFVTLLQPDQWRTFGTAALSYLRYPFVRHDEVRVLTHYLGANYEENALPWHYLPFLWLLTTPPLHVVAALLAPAAFRRGARLRPLALALLPFLGFWALCALLPSVPKHDGVRQFTALLALLGIAGWLGVMSIAEHRRLRGARLAFELWLVPAVGAAALLAAHPFGLSYYSELAGGLRGAERLGMEVSYNLEAVTPEVLAHLNAHAPRGGSVALLPAWDLLLLQYQWHGQLRPDLRVLPPGHERDADYLVLVHRRSLVPEPIYAGLPAELEVTHQGVPLAKVVRHP